MKLTVTVNDQEYTAEIVPEMLLVHFLRDEVGLTGTHIGCVVGRCGACTVLWNGRPVKSCMVYAVQTDGTEIMTVEGLAKNDELHPLQEAFLEADAVECGYCTPGMIMAAQGLLLRNPNPNDEDIKRAISGNLCRCTGYVNIVKAIKSMTDSRNLSLSDNTTTRQPDRETTKSPKAPENTGEHSEYSRKRG